MFASPLLGLWLRMPPIGARNEPAAELLADPEVKLPLTGRFAYVESWHDGYQKRVLAHEFKQFGAPMSDGRTVLDLVARHPATARFVVTKLCRRFLGENPPESVVAPAIDLWTKSTKAPDQIAQVVAEGRASTTALRGSTEEAQFAPV